MCFWPIKCPNSTKGCKLVTGNSTSTLSTAHTTYIFTISPPENSLSSPLLKTKFLCTCFNFICSSSSYFTTGKRCKPGQHIQLLQQKFFAKTSHKRAERQTRKKFFGYSTIHEDSYKVIITKRPRKLFPYGCLSDRKINLLAFICEIRLCLLK